MSWSKAGTVSVTLNSNAVIGVGTGFLSNSRVGDGFVGPDGALYEVTNIASDTAMSILPAYKGATAGSAPYSLIPVQGYPKALSDAFTALNNQFGATFAALGSTGTAAGIKTALGLDTTNGISEGSGNLYFTQARVLATPLTGMVLTDPSAVVAADPVVTAVGKLQSGKLSKSGGALTGAINEAPTVSLASAATVDIGAASSNTVLITGTTTITSLGVATTGVRRSLRFSGSLVLTYNGTSLYLLGGANITTASNDSAEFLSLGAGQWVCLRYNPASGKPLVKDFAYDRSNVVGIVSQSSGTPTGAVVQSGTTSNGNFTKYADGTMTCSYKALAASATGGADFAVTGFWGFPAPFISPPAVIAELGLNPSVTFNFTIAKKICISSGTQMDFRFRSDATQIYYWDLIAYGRWY